MLQKQATLRSNLEPECGGVSNAVYGTADDDVSVQDDDAIGSLKYILMMSTKEGNCSNSVIHFLASSSHNVSFLDRR